MEKRGKEQDPIVTERRKDTFSSLTHLVPGHHPSPPGQKKIGFKGDTILLFKKIFIFFFDCVGS